MLTYWKGKTATIEPAAEVPQIVIDAIADDLNTPLAISAIRALHNDPPRMLAGAQFLGLLTKDLGDWYQPLPRIGDTADAQLDAVLDAWHAARLKKDYKLADEIREKAHRIDVELRATPSGPVVAHPQRITPEWREALQTLVEEVQP
jgi:cysteinyl-tRNA synthetase